MNYALLDKLIPHRRSADDQARPRHVLCLMFSTLDELRALRAKDPPTDESEARELNEKIEFYEQLLEQQ